MGVEVEEGGAEVLSALGEDVCCGGADVGRGSIIEGGHFWLEGGGGGVIGNLMGGELREGETTLDAQRRRRSQKNRPLGCAPLHHLSLSPLPFFFSMRIEYSVKKKKKNEKEE